MIMTTAELRLFVETEESDAILETRLKAVEQAIRAYTNNNFQNRPFRAVAVAMADHTLIHNSNVPFEEGDTLEIGESEYQDGELVTIASVGEDGELTVNEKLYNESGVVITKVKYPDDVKSGVANLVKWDLEKRDKVGVASESISRHSVTYFNMDGDNALMGYPKSLLGFLKPYKRARFGRGFY